MSIEKRTIVLKKKSIGEKDKKDAAPIVLIGGSQRNIITNVSKPLALVERKK